jgi:immune inhibitor A
MEAIQMRRRFLAAVTAVVLAAAVAPAGATAAPPVANPRPVDIGPEIRDWEATPDRIAPANAAALAADDTAASAAVSASATDCITESKIFLILNDYSGRYQATYFNLMGDGSQAQVWVQANLAWPAADPRPTPTVTCDQVQYMLGQFQSNIYPKETSFFGAAAPHDGAGAYLPDLLGLPSDYYYDATGRQIVLVSNVRDENYYDPTYPLYIAGFYSPSFEVYFDRNVMSIDAYDWANRTGAAGTRPYLYEGVFAHEYQHLLHDDYDGDEELFVNEGMADLAEFLTGYGVATKGHVDAAYEKPENSLVAWGDQGDLEILTDYGQAYLFQLYLLEKLGPSFIQALFHNPGHGISGINAALAGAGSSLDFATLFHQWSVALLIDSKTPGGGAYQFMNVDGKANVGTPTSPNPDAYSTPGAPPWGTDYRWVTGAPKDVVRFSFNGVPYSTFPTSWTSDGSVLWGGTGDLVDNWAIFPATGGGTLTFDTKYDIEEFWDFGFVQASTDGGHTWTSLANSATTSDYDPDAHPKVVANLPGLTGSTGDAWVPMSFDLSEYAGQSILLAFRYVTDWSTTGAGWYVDNVMVNGTLVSDGSSAAAFKDLTEILPINNDFSVTFVGIKDSSKGNQYKVLTLDLDHATETGMRNLTSMLSWSNKAVVLVSFDAAEGTTSYADYSFTLETRSAGPKK